MVSQCVFLRFETLALFFLQMASKCFGVEVWLCLFLVVTVLMAAQLDQKKCCKEGDGGTECGGQLKPVGKKLSRARGTNVFLAVCTCASVTSTRFCMRTEGVRVHHPGVRVNLYICPPSQKDCIKYLMPLAKRERATYQVQDGATCVNKRRSSSAQRVFDQVMRERCEALKGSKICIVFFFTTSSSFKSQNHCNI